MNDEARERAVELFSRSFAENKISDAVMPRRSFVAHGLGALAAATVPRRGVGLRVAQHARTYIEDTLGLAI